MNNNNPNSTNSNPTNLNPTNSNKNTKKQPSNNKMLHPMNNLKKTPSSNISKNNTKKPVGKLKWCTGHNLRKGVAIFIFVLMLSNIILTLVYPENPTLGFWFQVMQLVFQVVVLILFVIFGWWMCYPLTAFLVLLVVSVLINIILFTIFLRYVAHDLKQAVSGPDDAHDRPRPPRPPRSPPPHPPRSPPPRPKSGVA